VRRLGIVFLGVIDDEGDYFAKLRHAICMAGEPTPLVKLFMENADTTELDEYI
jgi:hypothetical protein